MGSAVKSAAAPAAAALLAVGAAAVSAGRAAAEDAQSQALLATALTKNAGATKTSIAATEDWIAKQSMATGVADDEMRPALAALVRATGDTEKAQAGLATALDVSAATGKSVESVSQALAKGYAGNTSALGRLVPGMDAAVVASGDMDQVMAELAKTTGGSAAAAADTAAGKMKIMEVAMGEAQESAGAALLPAMSALAVVMAQVATFAQENSRLVQILAVVVAALAAAVLVANGVMAVWGTAVKVAAALQWAWNAAMSANPIALVIIAVVALVAVFVLLYKKSETVRNIVNAVWAAIRTGAQAAGAVVKAVWDAVFDAVSAYVRAYWAVVQFVFQAIRAAATAVAGAVREAWSNLWEALKTAGRAAQEVLAAVFRAVRDVANPIATGIRDAWANLWGALRSAVAGLGALLSAPFQTMKAAVDAVVGAVQNLINWLRNIKVPKINLPGPLSALAAPAPAVAAGQAAAPRVPGGHASPRAGGSGGINIVVNGALDPEATARQIRRILAGHDRRVGLAT
jgi:phage-related protein